MLGIMAESKRRKHLDDKLNCIMKEVNKYLKLTDMGFFKRRRFIKELKEIMKVHLIITWYPEEPTLGAENRTFTTKPMHWTFNQAAKSADVRVASLEHHLFGIDSISIHPEIGVVKYFNIPGKVIYDDHEILSSLDHHKMKKPSKKNTHPLLKRRKKLYVGTHGNNPNDGEQAIKLSTALERMHQNNLRLCNVCKHINTRRIMECLEDNVKDEIDKEVENIYKGKTNEYLMPRFTTKNVDNHEYHNYETIIHNSKHDEGVIPNEQREKRFEESTII